MWSKKLKSMIEKALKAGSSPEKLSLSFCMGLYIAFSPFPGVHAVMMVAANYLFKLNFPLLFAITSINNPWTMIPVYTLDYFVGYWVVHSLLGIEPSLTISLAQVFGGGSICLWSFLVGGNILGLTAALVAYPIVSTLFKKLVHSKQTQTS
jgi:uncharacterized protein (DUF2062 family)